MALDCYIFDPGAVLSVLTVQMHSPDVLAVPGLEKPTQTNPKHLSCVTMTYKPRVNPQFTCLEELQKKFQRKKAGLCVPGGA